MAAAVDRRLYLLIYMPISLSFFFFVIAITFLLTIFIYGYVTTAPKWLSQPTLD